MYDAFNEWLEWFWTDFPFAILLLWGVWSVLFSDDDSSKRK